MDNKKLVVTIENVTKVFNKKNAALKNVSINIYEKDFIVLGGSNGSGKSVLMSLIAGLDEPTEGRIILRGGKAGLVFQDADSQILGETPYEDVLFGVKNCGIKKEERNEVVINALDAVGLLQKKDEYSRSMSGGEKRRLAVAGILAINRNVIIFDEPFANLDYPGVKNVCAILKQLKDEGKTVIVLTHEIEKILGLADRFIVLDKGEIKFDGTVEDGLNKNLEEWNIRNPFNSYTKKEDLLWL